jgi:hypothetical protein
MQDNTPIGTPLFALPPDAAGREPVATVVKNDSGQIRLVGKDWLALDLSAHVGTKLYAAPPDAAEEIERLNKEIHFILSERDRTFALMLSQRERLREALKDIAVFGCGMLNQPAAANAPEEAWLRSRIRAYERVARAALATEESK